MTRYEKDLLLKDLCARLPYGVKVHTSLKPICKIFSKPTIYSTVVIDGAGEKSCNISDIKPYLFPLSSMTEGQKKQLKQHTCPDGTGYFDGYSLCCPVNHFGENIPFEFMAKIIDWLNKNHFDYRGLIEKGLAIDASNLNIY